MTISQTTIVHALHEAYSNGETWYGPNLRVTLTSLSLDQLVYSDTYEGYTAWELGLHCAYWKWLVGARLTGEPDAFPYEPADFPRLTREPTAENWERDLRYMDEQHARLTHAVEALSDQKLAEMWRNPEGVEQDGTVGRMIMSIALHDAYHTAQIRSMGLPGLVEPKR